MVLARVEVRGSSLSRVAIKITKGVGTEYNPPTNRPVPPLQTLYLIDGHNEIFRAYFAIRGGMRSPVTGEPTHAVFGFTSMLLRLLGERHPAYALVAMDASDLTFRHELFPAYKGHRGAAPEDLTAQIPRVVQVAEAFGFPVIGVEGLEADDIIGCIVHQVLNDPSCADVRIRIVSKDKDLEQLLCDRVTQYDIQNDAELDVAGLWEKRGIRPDQVVDVLALSGDAVDNVPGVEGIGPKTAAQLVHEFGSVDGVLANLDRIKGKRRENLERDREALLLSRELVRLKCDAEIPFCLEKARIDPVDLPKLLPLFRELGFNRFQQEARKLAGEGAEAAVVEVAPAEPAPAADLRVSEIRTPEELAEWLGATAEAPLLSVAVTGTTVGLSAERGSAARVALGPETAAVLRPVLEDEGRAKAGHAVKETARALLAWGLRLRGVMFDAMLAGQLLDPELANHDLAVLTAQYLGAPALADHPAAAAETALRLAGAMGERLRELGLEALQREVEAPLAPVVAEMEANGIFLDRDELGRQKGLLQERAAELRLEVWERAGFEFLIDSPKQLSEALFDRLGLQAGRKNKTGRSTAAEVLETLAAEEDPADPRTAVPRLVLEYRHLQKLLTTYMDQLRDAVDPRDGRVRCTFYQIYTTTGRMVAHNPNLQTIPIRTEVGRQIRAAFPAPPGTRLICADYSQIELRLLAHLSEDPGLLAAFEQGLDVHTAVAAEVFGVAPGAVTREQRSSAKTVNFGIIYGVSPTGLARRIEGLTVAGARQLIEDYRQRFPGIARFLSRCVQDALEQGYVTTLFGRRRLIPELQSGSRTVRSLGERLAINSVIQGSGADLIKLAMVRVQRRADRDRLPLKMLLSIHDELVFEAPQEGADDLARLIVAEMEAAAELRIPLKAEAGVGTDWLSCK